MSATNTPTALPYDPATVATARVRMALIDQAITLFQNRIELFQALTTHDDETKTAIQLYGEIIAVIGELRTKPAVIVPELEHDRMMRVKYNHEVSANGRLERRIVAALCVHMAQHGWLPVAVDGYDDGRKPATDTKSAMEWIFNLDEAWIVFRKGETEHEVFLVLGNGTDLISDWRFALGDRDGFNAAVESFDAERFA